MFSLEALRTWLPLDNPSHRYVVAYSGGLDSHVLLHSLTALGIPSLRAVHVNHQLHPDAGQWVQHCQQTCDSLNVPLTCLTVSVQTHHQQSIEAAARTARYDVLFSQLAPDEQLLTAHHRDDQAETVLLQLLRGAGPKGLSGMRHHSKALLRPLLAFSRYDLECYAQAHSLHWIQDTSNDDITFDRNFLRHTVMTQLTKRWPSVNNTLSHTAKLCAEADSLLSDLAAIDLSHLRASSLPADPNPDTYPTPILPGLTALRQLSPARQKNLLRHWFTSLNLPLPHKKKMQHILKDVINAKPDASPIVHWSTNEISVELKRYQNTLYLYFSTTPKTTQDAQTLRHVQLPWDFTTRLPLPDAAGGGWLVATSEEQLMPIDHTPYSIRFRQGGERCRLHHTPYEQSLKKLMQAWHIPPWQRDKIPLLYRNNTLMAVIGYAYCKDFDLPIKFDTLPPKD